MSFLAGIDIGGTKISAALVQPSGEVIATGTVPSPASQGGAAMLQASTSLLRSLERDAGQPARAVGVGAAGVLRDGVVRAASSLFPGWVGTDIAGELGSRLDRPVVAINDVNAFLLGELTWGSLAGSNSALALMLGTGVGAALMLDGEVYFGPSGAAGELGHAPGYSDYTCTCGGRGHLETVASGRSIGLRYGELTGRTGLSGADVAELASRGDEAALATIENAAAAIAVAITQVTLLLDVHDIVFGGGLTASWELLRDRIEAQLRSNPPVTGTLPSLQLGQLNNAAAGAAAAALAHHTATPPRSDSGRP